jgi:hypothetical protein
MGAYCAKSAPAGSLLDQDKSLNVRPVSAQKKITSITLRLYLNNAAAAPTAMSAEGASNSLAKP